MVALKYQILDAPVSKELIISIISDSPTIRVIEEGKQSFNLCLLIDVLWTEQPPKV